MTPLARTVAALSHREADRPPVFLLCTMQGAAEVGLPLPAYLRDPRALVEGQLRLRARFGHDCLYAFAYATAELEAWGGTSHFVDDGPPTSGAPVLRDEARLEQLEPPALAHPALQRTLEVISALRVAARGEVPVIGVVLSPFSLPALQLGMGPWLELLHAAVAEPASPSARRLARLLTVNERFTSGWAAAQVAAGATALVYFDPLLSPTMTPEDIALPLGLPVAQRVLAGLGAPSCLHLASGRVGGRLEALLASGASLLSVSAQDDLPDLKRRVAGRAALIGNLNGIEMARWSPWEASLIATRALDEGAAGGGFILADNHGEIPFGVPDDVLHALVEACRRWPGRAARADG